ncbi:MAG: hypothetical protein JWM42_3768 [Burkholderia sp.]|nr:hypothetical protein [Burkholderia sp.]
MNQFYSEKIPIPIPATGAFEMKFPFSLSRTRDVSDTNAANASPPAAPPPSGHGHPALSPMASYLAAAIANPRPLLERAAKFLESSLAKVYGSPAHSASGTTPAIHPQNITGTPGPSGSMVNVKPTRITRQDIRILVGKHVRTALDGLHARLCNKLAQWQPNASSLHAPASQHTDALQLAGGGTQSLATPSGDHPATTTQATQVHNTAETQHPEDTDSAEDLEDTDSIQSLADTDSAEGLEDTDSIQSLADTDATEDLEDTDSTQHGSGSSLEEKLAESELTYELAKLNAQMGQSIRDDMLAMIDNGGSGGQPPPTVAPLGGHRAATDRARSTDADYAHGAQRFDDIDPMPGKR